MKKTLYVLFVFLLMICGNVKVLANVNNNTQESDGGGSVYSDVCRYTYTDTEDVLVFFTDKGYYKAQIVNGKNVLYDTTIEAEEDYLYSRKPFSFDFSYDEWIEAANNSKSDSGCPYFVYVAEQRQQKGLFSSEFEVYYRLQLTEYGFFAGFGWHQYIAPCKDCVDLNFDDVVNSGNFKCEDLIGTDMILYINQGMYIIKILVPVLLIAFGTFDFLKAVFASNDDEMKKAQKTFVKRLIIAVIIYFSPLIVNFLIDITNDAAGFTNSGTCGIK